MGVVIFQLKADVHENEKEGGHADGQSQDVDKGEDAVAPEITEGDLQIVFDHVEAFWAVFV